MKQKISDPINSMRIDKWLWFARFYKTRGAACNAIKSGKILLNNKKARPSKVIKAGDQIRIRQGPYNFYITVRYLPKSRKPSREASMLFEEPQESVNQRQMITQKMKAEAANYPRTKGRPGKRERRELIRFKVSNYTS